MLYLTTEVGIRKEKACSWAQGNLIPPVTLEKSVLKCWEDGPKEERGLSFLQCLYSFKAKHTHASAQNKANFTVDQVAQGLVAFQWCVSSLSMTYSGGPKTG